MTVKMAAKLKVAKITGKPEVKRSTSQFIRKVKADDMIEHLS